MSYRGAPRVLFPELESVRRLKESRQTKEFGVQGMRWGQKKPTGEPEEQRGKAEQAFWNTASSLKKEFENLDGRTDELGVVDVFRAAKAWKFHQAANKAYMEDSLGRAAELQGEARKLLDKIPKKAPNGGK